LVNYNFTNPFVIEENTVNFRMPTLEEVKNLPKQKRKEYRTIAKSFLATATTFLMLPLRSMAQSSVPTGTTTLPQTATGMPPELLELLLMLLKISVGAAVILAAILLVANAVGKMFRLNGMTQWAKDIIRGLIQVLIAVPVVFLIYYLANLLFSGNGWFVSPF
jgi:FtsH-binding integral membrane protein